MKMSKNYKKLCLALGLSGILGASAVTAQSGTKNIQATYRDIQVTYNGVTQSMSAEPFLINGTTYVPLRAVGDIFGASANYNTATNTVVLTGGSSATSQEQVSQLTSQVAMLTQQLNEARTELAQYKANNMTPSTSGSTNGTSTGNNITTEQLQKTEDYLNADHYDFNGINMSYDLTLSGSQINVAITYETRSENRTFNSLSESKIESFMKKIGDNIAATHADIVINGTIEYIDESEEKASFTRNKNGKYSYTHAFDENKIKEVLEEITNNYFYFNGLSNVSSLSISDCDVTIRPQKSTVNAKLYLSPNEQFKTTWNSTEMNDSKRKSAVSSQLDDLQLELIDITNGYDVTIQLYYDNNLIAQIDANGKVTA